MLNRYMEMKYGKKKDPIEVTEEKLLALFVANGMPEEDAKRQVQFSKAIGGSTEINGELYRIVG